MGGEGISDNPILNPNRAPTYSNFNVRGAKEITHIDRGGSLKNAGNSIIG